MAPRPPPLRELAWLFARLGLTSFGGPAAHIAMMQDEVVKRRAWLSEERFLDLLGVCNLIPGPSSTELAIHIGYERARFRGLVIAGLCFILPAVLLTALLAALYVEFGALPEALPVLAAIKPVLLAVILQAIFRLAPRATRTLPLRLIGLCALVAALFHVDELVILIGAGLLSILLTLPTALRRSPMMLAPLTSILSFSQIPTPTPDALFWTFAKIGGALFGSGYVLLAFLPSALASHHGWLSEAQLIDAVAIGQITPGPVFSTATFIGWVLAGPAGAMTATAGIFLPSFVFVALSAPIVSQLRRSPTASAFIDGVNVASIALMIAVLVELALTAVTGPSTALVAIIAAVLILRYELNSGLVLAGAALCGLAVGLA